MPRTNPTRVIGSEAALRRRIAYEREKNGWSPAGLASRMTQAGCPIRQSAIWKIENADRGISVDELVALSRVLKIFPMEELLIPPEIAADKRAHKLIEEYQAALDAAVEASMRLFEHLERHPRVEAIMQETLSPEEKLFGARFAVEKMSNNRGARSKTGD